MAQVTINSDGTIAIELTPQEQALAVMLAEEEGATQGLANTFQQWFSNATKSVIAARFDRMTNDGKSALLAALTLVKPEKAQGIPVRRVE